MTNCVNYLLLCLLTGFAFGFADCGEDELRYEEELLPLVKKIQLMVNRQGTSDIVFLLQKHDEDTNIVLNYVSDGYVYIQNNNDTKANEFADPYPKLIYNDVNDMYLYAVPNYSGKGPVAEMLAKYFMQKAVDMAMGIKIIIAINSEDVKSSQDIDLLLAYLSEIFPNWKSLKSSLIFLGVADEVCKSSICEEDMIPGPSIELCAKANIETFQNPWIVTYENKVSERIYIAKSPIQDYLNKIPTYHHINNSFFSSLSDTSKSFHENMCYKVNEKLTSVLQVVETHVEDINNKILPISTNIFVDIERIVKSLEKLIFCLNNDNVSLRNLIPCLASYQIHVDGLVRHVNNISEISVLVNFCEAFSTDLRQFFDVAIENSIKDLYTKLDLYLKQQIIWNSIFKSVYKYFTSEGTSFEAKSYRNESKYDLDAFTKDVNVYDMFDVLRPHEITKLDILRAFIRQFESTTINMEYTQDCMELFIMGNFITVSKIDKNDIPFCGFEKPKKVVIFAYIKLIVDTIPLIFQNQSLALISPKVKIHDFDLKEYLEVNHAGSVFLLLGSVVIPNHDINHMVVYKRDNGTIQWNSKEIFDLSISQFKLNFMRTTGSRYVNDYQFLNEIDSLLYGQGEVCSTQVFLNEIIGLETYLFEEKRYLIPLRKQFLKNIEIYFENPCSHENLPEYKSILKDLYALAWSELNTMLNTYDGSVITNLTSYMGLISKRLENERYNLQAMIEDGGDYYDFKSSFKDRLEQETNNLDDFERTIEELIGLREKEIVMLLDLIQNFKNLSDTPMETITKYRKHLVNKLNEKMLLDTLVTIQQHFKAVYSFLNIVSTISEDFDSYNDNDLLLYTKPAIYISMKIRLDTIKHEINKGHIIDNVIATLKNSSTPGSFAHLQLTNSDLKNVRQSRKKFLEVYSTSIQYLNRNENFTQVVDTEILKDKWCEIVIAFASSNLENYNNDKDKIMAHCEIVMDLSGDIYFREKSELLLAPLIEQISDCVNFTDGKNTHSEFVSALDRLNIPDQLKYLNAQLLRPLSKLSHVSNGLSQSYQDLIFISTRLAFIAETSFQVTQNQLFMKHVKRKWKPSSEVTLFENATSKYLEPMLLSNLAYAFYMKTWNTAKELVFPYVESLPDRNIKYYASSNDHNIRSAVSYKLRTLQSDLKFNDGPSRHTLLRVWKYEEYGDQIDRLLREEIVGFETDIIKDSVDTWDAIKINDLYIVVRAHRNETQAEVDKALLQFSADTIHSGMSIFMYCGEYYTVNTGRAYIDQAYYRTKNTAYNYNEVYRKFHTGNPIFSPYTKWKIGLSNYDRHKSLLDYHGKVDLELYGNIVTLSLFDQPPGCQFTNVSKYYTHYTPFNNIINYV